MNFYREKDHCLHVFNVHRDAVSAIHLVRDIMYSSSHDKSICKVDLVVSLNTPLYFILFFYQKYERSDNSCRKGRLVKGTRAHIPFIQSRNRIICCLLALTAKSVYLTHG